ncbi:MAG: carboxypeptidase regulatory-like domain-containing protein [Acidobacteria bacterium]|nr:carboxypeptidase regulatory-like domain-containing protein [Acidobacteriota bacterium]MBI3658500.1 carboxypeptidase regulatory-like domain-containing protein [Acidobacteriota bacterium]
MVNKQWQRLVWLCVMIAGWEQEITGTIAGVVQDQSGSVVPGVEVYVGNLAINFEKKTLTSDVGVHAVPLLPTGRYDVSAEMPAFNKFVENDSTRIY